MKKILLLAITAVALSACTQKEAYRGKLLAHRGFCTTNGEVTTDENTLDALIRAQEAGVDAVEFDVHLTSDGQMVIRHENKIAPGLSCQGSTFEEIRAYTLPFGHQIPTLREWLEQAKKTPQIQQCLEIKAHPGDQEKIIIQKSLEIIKELDMMDQVSMLSFKPETLDEVIRQEPNMRTVLNSSSLHGSLTPEEVKQKGYTGVSYNVNVFLNHPEWIKVFQDYGIETYLWMTNSIYLRDLANSLGFTWLTTDYFDLINYSTVR